MTQDAGRRKVVAPQMVAQLPQLTPDLYHEIFVHSREAIAIISINGHYIEQNGAHYQLLGYSDSELNGRTPAMHLGEETFGRITSELIANGNYRGEVISRTKDGTEKHLDLSAFAMRNSVGEPVCYIGIKRDVTERKNADEALRRSEMELADFFENASIGMYWIGPDDRITRVNQAQLDMLGYTREDYVGRPISAFHVDGKVIDAMLERLRSGEVLQEFEARMLARDGSIKNVQISSSVLWDDTEFVHTRCFTRDITERRRAQQRLELQYAVTRVLSASSDFTASVPDLLRTICECLDSDVGGLWQVDNQSQTLYCVDFWHTPQTRAENFQAQSQNIRIKRGEGLPGRIWASGEPAWIPNAIEDPNFPRAAAAKEAGLHGAFGFPILIGKEVLGIVEFFYREIRQPDEDLLKVMRGLGDQIGQFKERARAERDLEFSLNSEKAARAEAEHANRLKDEFLATLSHELRTPLNAVIGWAKMLRSGRLDGESSRHALEVIERNAWAQQQIIEDILDVSRVVTGKLQLHLGPVRIASVVAAALDAVNPALQAKGIKIETSISQNLNIISGDADRLQQVVWNLLSNAAKFTPAGGSVRIDVTKEDSQLQIAVQDSGPGIPNEFLPHVFERFRQADGSTTRTHGGLGLGLAIVRHLVELHGGTIAAENRGDGLGAVFVVRLPLPSSDLTADEVPETNASGERVTSRVNLDGLRILVVDDDIDALDLITIELSQQGASVKAVMSGAEALAELNRSEFDVLIADIGMPEMDGYQLIRRLRHREAGSGKRIPAVALTGYARVQDRMRAVIAGYNTHAAKPIETDELLTVVASLAGRYDNKN